MKSRLSFASRWLKLAKNGRHPRGAVRRYLLLAMAVLVFAFGLVTVGGDPPLLDAEPAAAHHCDSYSGDWQAVCELVHACTNSGGTVSQGTCVYPPPTTTTTTTLPPTPTTTTTTTTLPPIPTTTTTTTTTRPPVVRPVTATCHRHGSYFVNNECHTHPTNKACDETVWVHTHDLQNLHTTYEVTASPPCAPPPCPVGEHWFLGACQSVCIPSHRWVNDRCHPRCAASHRWVPPSGSGNGSCEPRCTASQRWVNGSCEPRCAASERWVPPSGPPSATSGFCQSLLCTPDDDQHRHEYANYVSICHDDHTDDDCPTDQHLVGHDGCHSGHSHTAACPTGQFKAPFPELVSKVMPGIGGGVNGFLYGPPGYYRDRQGDPAEDTVPVEWVGDEHTGCKAPKHPQAINPCLNIRAIEYESAALVGSCYEADPTYQSHRIMPGVWDALRSTLKGSIEATGDFLVKEISKLPGSDVINLVLCAYPEEQVLVGTAIANRAYITRTATAAQLTRRAIARTNLASAAFDLALEQVYCSALERADTTTTTTTTTTVPPTTTTTTTTTVPPPSLPVVTSLPDYDRVNYQRRFYYDIDAVPSSCTPWVYWQIFPTRTVLAALCPR